MGDTTGELDASAGPTGVSVRTKGYRLMDLAWGAAVAGIIYIGVLVTFHAADAAKDSATVAQALKESNQKVADAVKDQARESNQILREIARATREQNCLSAQGSDARRVAMAETCKRLAQ